MSTAVNGFRGLEIATGGGSYIGLFTELHGGSRELNRCGFQRRRKIRASVLDIYAAVSPRHGKALFGSFASSDGILLSKYFVLSAEVIPTGLILRVIAYQLEGVSHDLTYLFGCFQNTESSGLAHSVAQGSALGHTCIDGHVAGIGRELA